MFWTNVDLSPFFLPLSPIFRSLKVGTLAGQGKMLKVISHICSLIQNEGIFWLTESYICVCVCVCVCFHLSGNEILPALGK